MKIQYIKHQLYQVPLMSVILLGCCITLIKFVCTLARYSTLVKSSHRDSHFLSVCLSQKEVPISKQVCLFVSNICEYYLKHIDENIITEHTFTGFICVCMCAHVPLCVCVHVHHYLNTVLKI